MKILKTIAKRKLASAGYELVPNWMSDQVPLRDHLRKLFAHYKVTCVLDVGANIGQYANFLRQRVGYAGDIVSFEPVQESYAALLAASKGDPKWRSHRLALGAERATLSINVTRGSVHSSFYEPDQAAVKHTGLDNQIENSRVLRTEQVEVETLDNFLGSIESRSIYLKMDTQGYDRQVLEGARNSTDRFAGVQTEAAIQKLYLGAPGYQEMTQFVTSFGFQLSGFFPVNHDAALRLIECDMVFVRPAHSALI
jgi:FkbM family methyltransferase